MDSYKHKLIFLHIEKAGGSTLHNIFSNFYNNETVLHLNYMSTGEMELRDHKARASLQLIKGHVLFGQHRFAESQWKYYSMMRDPVARVQSYFFYVRQKSLHHHSELILKNKWSISDYILKAENLQMDNGQVRYISGSQKPFGEINSDDLELAKRNIEEHFLGVGLTERFDESLVFLKVLLGWKLQPVYERANVNLKKEKEIPDLDLAVIHQFNRFDRELYRFAKERFELELQKRDISYDLKKLQRSIKYYHFKKKLTGIFR